MGQGGEEGKRGERSQQKGGRKAMRPVKWQSDGGGEPEDVFRTVMLLDLLKLCVALVVFVFHAISWSPCHLLLLAQFLIRSAMLTNVSWKIGCV